ncbi:hypothetical protein [Leucobacter luti]|uniref:hypothetical protein n=1 Tax=Leucobacter luti TaxID=340320 RepID=UPI003D036313
MARHAIVPAPEYPAKRTLRTGLAVAIPAVIALVGVLPEILQIVVDELGGHLPDGIRLWLLGAAAVLTAVAMAVTRIMAIPIVNDWLSRHSPFGSEPSYVARSRE